MNKINPLVSVFVPSYNHRSFVKECIEGIINQSYERIELLIIDDGSTDDSCDILNQLVDRCKDRFVRFELIQRGNKGLSYTMNEGLNWAQGEYFSPIASDDVMLESKIKSQVTLIHERSDVACVFSGVSVIDHESNTVRVIRRKPGYVDFYDLFLMRKNVLAPTFLGKTSILKELGGYPEGLYIEDLYMWLKVASLKYKIYQSDDILVAYRRHSNNISSNLIKMHFSRIAILNYYKNDRSYKTALSLAHVQHSVELLEVSRLKSALVFLNAISTNIGILFQLKSCHYIVRFFIPSKVYYFFKNLT